MGNCRYGCRCRYIPSSPFPSSAPCYCLGGEVRQATDFSSHKSFTVPCLYFTCFFYFLLLFLLLLCREILSETNDIVNNISWQAISSSPHFCRGLYCMKFVESFQFILFHVEVQFSNGIFVFMHNFFHNSLLFLFICFWYCNFLLLLLLSCTTFYFWLLRSKVLPLFISQVIENFIYL